MNLNKIIVGKDKLLLTVFFLIIAIWAVPWPYFLPTSALDPSWVIGLYKATANGMQFGHDIAFTLGPLGFMFRQFYIDPELWLVSITFILLTHFLFIFSIALLMVKSSATWKEYIILIPILLISVVFLGDYELM